MPKLVWSASGNKKYETGLSHGVLYVMEAGVYPKGEVWDGLTSVTEAPGGAEPTDLYADDIKYASLRSAETFGLTIEAYAYPESFGACDGTAAISPGVYIGQQARKTFGFVYRSQVGSDTLAQGDAYKLHLIYGCTASPSEKPYQTVNDSPEAITFTWEVTTIPVPVPGFKPTASIIVDSATVSPEKMEALETILFGGEGAPGIARLPLPAEILTIIAP